MSLTSATGGGSVTPGWYTDPHDPSQLRWWSGEGWTEHVSPGAAPVVTTPVAQAPIPVAAPVAEAAPTVPVQAAQDAPLPSRRALRDPSVEANDASAAAEAALASQAAAQQAQFAEQQAQQQANAQAEAAAQAQAQAAAQAAALAAAQAQAAQQAAYPAPQAAMPPVQPEQAAQPAYEAPVAAQQPSAPVPTLPVAPTSFLEQQGYAPLDGATQSIPAATDPGAWGQPVAAAQPVQPVQPPLTAAPLPPEQALPPVETPQPNAWNQPLQAEQPVQPVAPVQPNAWNQPVAPIQPVAPVQPEQQGWGAPAAAPTAGGMDSLFGTAPADPAIAQSAQASQWGLAPATGDTGAGQQADAASGVAGSSSFWAWLIAISPILAAGSITYVLLATKSTLTSWPFEAAVAAPFLLVLLFALADRAALINLGHTNPRSPAWALLSAPVYLIARAGETRREDGTGTALTLVWFISFIVAVGGIVGYGFLTHHALIAGLPT